MTEAEYIKITNKEKIKIAKDLLCDTLPDDILTEKIRIDLVKILSKLSIKYNKEIKLEND